MFMGWITCICSKVKVVFFTTRRGCSLTECIVTFIFFPNVVNMGMNMFILLRRVKIMHFI